MDKPTPIRLQKFLAGLDYPASRDDLVGLARSHGADDATVDSLRALPDRTFHGPNAVSQAYSHDS